MFDIFLKYPEIYISNNCSVIYPLVYHHLIGSNIGLSPARLGNTKTLTFYMGKAEPSFLISLIVLQVFKMDTFPLSALRPVVPYQPYMITSSIVW